MAGIIDDFETRAMGIDFNSFYQIWIILILMLVLSLILYFTSGKILSSNIILAIGLAVILASFISTNIYQSAVIPFLKRGVGTGASAAIAPYEYMSYLLYSVIAIGLSGVVVYFLAHFSSMSYRDQANVTTNSNLEYLVGGLMSLTGLFFTLAILYLLNSVFNSFLGPGGTGRYIVLFILFLCLIMTFTCLIIYLLAYLGFNDFTKIIEKYKSRSEEINNNATKEDEQAKKNNTKSNNSSSSNTDWNLKSNKALSGSVLGLVVLGFFMLGAILLYFYYNFIARIVNPVVDPLLITQLRTFLFNFTKAFFIIVILTGLIGLIIYILPYIGFSKLNINVLEIIFSIFFSFIFLYIGLGVLFLARNLPYPVLFFLALILTFGFAVLLIFIMSFLGFKDYKNAVKKLFGIETFQNLSTETWDNQFKSVQKMIEGFSNTNNTMELVYLLLYFAISVFIITAVCYSTLTRTGSWGATSIVLLLLLGVLIYIFYKFLKPVGVNNLWDIRVSSSTVNSQVYWIMIIVCVFIGLSVFMWTLTNAFGANIFNLFAPTHAGDRNRNQIALICSIFLIIGAFVSIFAALGLGKAAPLNKDKSKSLLYYSLIASALIVCVAFWRWSNGKQLEKTLKSRGHEALLIYQNRNKYSIYLIVYIISLILLYSSTPAKLLADSPYGAPVLMAIVFMGIVLFLLITSYQFFYKNIKTTLSKPGHPEVMNFLNGFYLIALVAIAGGFLYWIITLTGVLDPNINTSKKNIFSLVVVFLLVAIMLLLLVKFVAGDAIFSKVLMGIYEAFKGVFLAIFSIFKVLFSLITSIGNLIDYYFKYIYPFIKYYLRPDYAGMLIIVLFVAVVILFYIYVMPYLSKSTGQQLQNTPLSLSQVTGLNGYESLTHHTYFMHSYCLSFWFYLDAFSPSMENSFNTTTNVISFVENPMVKYDGRTNTLIFLINQQVNTEETPEGQNPKVDLTSLELPSNVVDYINERDDMRKHQDRTSMAADVVKDADDKYSNIASDMRVLYKHPNVLLQKWNNVVINNYNGTMDIFYNGSLVNTSINVVPRIINEDIIVGQKNGISGDIVNIVYYPEPQSFFTIYSNYNNNKNKDIPIDTNKITNIEK
jgi:MFS family permease